MFPRSPAGESCAIVSQVTGEISDNVQNLVQYRSNCVLNLMQRCCNLYAICEYADCCCNWCLPFKFGAICQVAGVQMVRVFKFAGWPVQAPFETIGGGEKAGRSFV